MKEVTKLQLFQAWRYCDDEDKSTEFMLAYMADIVPGWDDSDVVEFMSEHSDEYLEWAKGGK